MRSSSRPDPPDAGHQGGLGPASAVVVVVGLVVVVVVGAVVVVVSGAVLEVVVELAGVAVEVVDRWGPAALRAVGVMDARARGLVVQAVLPAKALVGA